MKTIYGYDCPNEVIKKTITRLTNQIWKLIPMYENNENWKKQLDNVIVEVVGLSQVFVGFPDFTQLICKLEGLKNYDIEFNIYRGIVFDLINLLQGLGKNYAK